MKSFLILTACWSCLASSLFGQAGLQEALRKMPLKADIILNRDNCLPMLLSAFQSNAVVKALVFLPAVSDDFYLINRDQPKLDLKADNLLAAITALTNATAVRATFRAPCLLLHLDRDALEPKLFVHHPGTVERLKKSCHLPHALWVDTHWERLQPTLQEGLKVKILPAGPSSDAWHFARHNLAAWNLPDWELAVALSLSGKTSLSVEANRLVFTERD